MKCCNMLYYNLLFYYHYHFFFFFFFLFFMWNSGSLPVRMVSSFFFVYYMLFYLSVICLCFLYLCLLSKLFQNNLSIYYYYMIVYALLIFRNLKSLYLNCKPGITVFQYKISKMLLIDKQIDHYYFKPMVPLCRPTCMMTSITLMQYLISIHTYIFILVSFMYSTVNLYITCHTHGTVNCCIILRWYIMIITSFLLFQIHCVKKVNSYKC